MRKEREKESDNVDAWWFVNCLHSINTWTTIIESDQGCCILSISISRALPNWSNLNKSEKNEILDVLSNLKKDDQVKALIVSYNCRSRALMMFRHPCQWLQLSNLKTIKRKNKS